MQPPGSNRARVGEGASGHLMDSFPDRSVGGQADGETKVSRQPFGARPTDSTLQRYSLAAGAAIQLDDEGRQPDRWKNCAVDQVNRCMAEGRRAFLERFAKIYGDAG
jgi:hypothetical protein